ncbi:MAG TPA: VWA domain-containing protein, partial [bacterium (Candidatus Stahlbacteria)]|nr:VWA domain-containing protein [Candidatus Stahlbacteria bacterium]
MAKPLYNFIFLIIMVAQLPVFGQSVDWVRTIYPEEQSAAKNGDRVVIIARVVGSPERVVCDASVFGDSSQKGFPLFDMYDDGVHNDSLYNDRIYGTSPIVVRASAGYHPVKVIPYPTGGIGYGKIGIDNTTPYVWESKAIYHGAQTAAKEHDKVRIVARARDALPSIDVVLVTDNSGSMADTVPGDTISKMDRVKLAANKLMDKLESDDRVALYAFDGGYNAYAKRYMGFTKNKNAIIEIVNTFTPNNNSPLYDVLFLASQYAQKSPNFTAVIALTDGRNYAPRGERYTRYDCYFQAIPIFVVGIGGALKIDKEFLDSLATTSTRGKYYYTIFEKDLDVIYQEILDIIKSTEIPIGVNKLIVDTKPIGGYRDELLYDDGYHDDGYASDNIYGSDLISVNTNVTAIETLLIRVVDVAQNQATDLVWVAMDNMPPNISAFMPHYMQDNFAAFDGDSIYYTAEVSDLGIVSGIISVKLDASSIGGGTILAMKDDGMGNDTLANDGVYTSGYITISTGGTTSILTVKVVAEDVAGNNRVATTNTLVDNSPPIISSGEVVYPFNQTAAKRGDFIILVAKIEERGSGFKDGFPYVDASTIGGSKNVPLYDDGCHFDGASGDGMFGTDSIQVAIDNFQSITIHVEDGGDGGYAVVYDAATASTFYGCLDEDGPSADRSHTTEHAAIVAFDASSGTIVGEIAFDQTTYRFYDNADSVQPGVAKAAENTTITGVANTDVVRIRMAVQVGLDDLSAFSQAFKLQYGEATSTCDQIGTRTDVDSAGGTGIWQGYDNVTPADGASITSSLLNSQTNALESYEEQNNSVNNPAAITQGS